ncbi:hypothetical protein Hanom_Chr02g00102541 [Helianthus anomalus]
MHASVPELTNRTISILGTADMTILASTFSRRHGAPKLVPFFIVSAKAVSTCNTILFRKKYIYKRKYIHKVRPVNELNVHELFVNLFGGKFVYVR